MEMLGVLSSDISAWGGGTQSYLPEAQFTPEGLEFLKTESAARVHLERSIRVKERF